ncbi:hypothetical protein AB0K27_12770 [Micromonospora echinospora]|uniref:hypothetical protein n=1 Tax=Micromonospora echinospora TaxID=1877 RepID=UPI00343744D9
MRGDVGPEHPDLAVLDAPGGAGEPSLYPIERTQDDPPSAGVCAVARGHRTIIGCFHKPSMINAVAASAMPNAEAK